jgi:hypothetical protein
MSDATPPQDGVEPCTGSRFGRVAATWSVLSPFLAILTYAILLEFLWASGRTGTGSIAARMFALLPFVVIIAGSTLGIVALLTTPRRDRKGVFGRAITGICVNALLVMLLVAGPWVLRAALARKYPVTPQGRLEAAERTLTAASHRGRRFYALDDAAKESFVAGKVDDASRYAKELLSLAPQFEGNWNYGNAIQDGNIVLGRIAVREGRIQEAKNYLLAAGRSPGSPVMDTFGPNMSLAKDLLEKGERDTVLQYFELCRKFWESDQGKLDDWSREVKAGEIPKFGANLVY